MSNSTMIYFLILFGVYPFSSNNFSALLNPPDEGMDSIGKIYIIFKFITIVYCLKKENISRNISCIIIKNNL